MTQPEAQAVATVKTEDGMTIEVDNTAIIERFEKKLKDLEERLSQEKKKDPQGKGVVEARLGGNSEKLIEQLKHVERGDIKEQWTIVIPNYTEKEVAGHLRDYVFVSDVIKGAVGDIVEIPYVKDFDFEFVAAGAGFTGKTSLISTLTTTLKEAGTYYDCSYADIEKIDQNLLDELNRTFAHAAVRAEDAYLMDEFWQCTTNSFAGTINMPHTIDTYFESEWIPDAIGKLLSKGKEVHPGDLVLWITPEPYAALLAELAASQAIAYARGDIITKGMVEDYLGVRIVVGGLATHDRLNAGGGSSYEVAYVFRAKRALCLAPKRDILIETDRIIKTRKLTITGSHTFGVELLDARECVRIMTGKKAAHTTDIYP